MQPNDSCLEIDQLLALYRGELSPEDQELACHHLSVCPACEQRLEALEDAEGVLSNLRRFAGREPWVDPAEYRGLEERAKGIRLGALGLPLTAHTLQGYPPPGEDRPPRPTRLGKYQLGEELGSGGMGVVYRAYHTRLGRECAVKVVRPEYAYHPTVVARFIREALALGGLVHDNIVIATDADEADGRPFLVMELIDGLDLETLVRGGGALPVAAACEIIRQAAVGLQAVHEKKRVHRDLKPSNLMLSTNGVVKVLDLGLAGILADDVPGGNLTGSRQVMGTVDYMAPEQWIDSHSVDIRADIYSLGCTLYKLLVGTVPFAGPEYCRPGRKELAHAEAPRPSAHAARAEVSPELDAVVRRMMAPDRTDRYPTPLAVAEALTPFAAAIDGLVAAARVRTLQHRDGLAAGPLETGVHHSSTPVSEASNTLPVKPRRRRWLPAATVLMAATGALAWGLAAGRGPVEQAGPNDPAPDPVVVPGPNEPLPDRVEEGPVLPPEGTWYNVLDRKPRTLFDQDPKFKGLQAFDPQSGVLNVSTSYVTLLGFAKVDRASYQIQVGIRQTRWDGPVGLFFGYHEELIRGKKCFKYQSIELRPFNKRIPKQAFLLSRSWQTLEDSQGRPWMTVGRAIDSEFLEQLKNSQEYILHIEVGPRGLTRVSWDGKPLPKLVKARHNATFKESDYIGWFGAYNRSSGSAFANARLMLFKRKPQ